MYKFLLPLIALAAFLLPTSQAEAGHYGRRYSRCAPYYGRPVVVYRDDCYRPYYRSYYRPVRYYSDCDYGYYAPRARVVVSRPRFAFSFGF